MNTTRFSELLQSKAWHSPVSLDGIQRKREQCLAVAQRGKFPLCWRMQGSSAKPLMLCPFVYWREGRTGPQLQQVHCRTPARAAAGRRQENKLSSLRDIFFHSAWPVSKGTISLCPLSASCGLSVAMVWQWTRLSSQHVHGTNTSPHHTRGTGAEIPCGSGCVAFGDSLTPKSSLLCRRQSVIPSQKSCPDLLSEPSTDAVREHGVCSTTSVRTKVSPWASVSNMTAEPWQLGLWAEGCKIQQPPEHPCCDLQLTGKLPVILKFLLY